MSVDRRIEHERCGISEDRQQLLDQEKRPLEIDRDRSVEARLVPLIERPEIADTRIDEDGVEASEASPLSMFQSTSRRFADVDWLG